MVESLVLDTNIFIHFINSEKKFFASSMKIINIIDDNQLTLTLDHQCLILSEYNNQINNCENRTVKDFISQFLRRNMSNFNFVDPIKNEEIQELIDKNFHKKDQIFVLIAPKSSLRKILSTDNRSFLDKKHKKWINENLNVICQDPNDFIQHYKKK